MASLAAEIVVRMSAEKVDNGALVKRLTRGHQTEPEDHQVIARLLQLRLTIHHVGPAGCVEEVLGPEDGKPLHLRFSSRLDGEGQEQRHWDALVRNLPEVEPTDTAAPDPLKVTHCITLKSKELIAALLCGHKDVENRRFRMQGWVAVHVSKTETSEADKQRVRDLCSGDLQTSHLPLGHICGLIFVSAAPRIQDYLTSISCDCPVNKHKDSCIASPWATGPFLNLVTRAITLKSPMPANGNQGMWPIAKLDLGRLREKLRAGAFSEFVSPAGGGIRPWPIGVARTKPKSTKPASCGIL